MMNLFSTKVAYADFNSFLANVNHQIINPLIVFLFALAMVYFLYGMLEFFMNQENEEKRTTSKKHMLWGIVGLTIMMGVWVILGIILSTTGIDSEINPEQGKVTLPDFKPPTTSP
jgi:uncharacterized membrane protein YidH (DUF202 family)